MFTLDDLWRLIEFLKDGTLDPKLSSLTRTLAASEKQVATNLFENTLDQSVFATDDYIRLRDFFIDWYAAHRTITSTQRSASDVYTLPDEHVSELFRSFGFDIGLSLVPLQSKANFFLDLVNFYKKKGTPETLADVLDYYGFSDTNIIEYWLMKDDSGDLIFRGIPIRKASTGATVVNVDDVGYNYITEDDPHWMTTLSQCNSLIDSNVINIPSKSPYFSLNSIFYFDKLLAALPIFQRVVQDQYERYQAGLSISQNITIKNLGEVVSLLELYISVLYVFERMYGTGGPTFFRRYLCYDETMDYFGDPPEAQNLPDLSQQFSDLISETPPSRAERDSRLTTYFDEWTRPLFGSNGILFKDYDIKWDSPPYITNSGLLTDLLLNEINPHLKEIYDSWFAANDEFFLLSYLVGTIDNWIRYNIDSKTPSLVITMLGLAFRDEIKELINFFTPYRARIAFIDTAYSIKNPLHDSVLFDEIVYDVIIQEIYEDIQIQNEIVYQYIEMSFTSDHVCKRLAWLDYDTGGYYDELIALSDVVDIEVTQTHDTDSISVTDQPINVPIAEYHDGIRDLGGARQMDVGYEYDELYQLSVVEDHVLISSTVFFTGTSSSVSSASSMLTFGKPEIFTGTINIISTVSASDLTT